MIVHDSLKTTNHYIEVKKQIRLIYREEMTHIKYANVTQQNHLPICGVLALAFAFSLFFGTDPETVNYDLSKCRNHLKVCLSNGHIQPFPSEQSLVQTSTGVLQSTQLPQEPNFYLLDAYFMDQTLRSEGKQ